MNLKIAIQGIESSFHDMAVKKMFPKKEISDPDLLNVHYWPYGIHLWKKGVDYKSITKDIIQPIANQEVYICNEAYSKQQRWMEGAVEMSNRVVKHIYEK